MMPNETGANQQDKWHEASGRIRHFFKQHVPEPNVPMFSLGPNFDFLSSAELAELERQQEARALAKRKLEVEEEKRPVTVTAGELRRLRQDIQLIVEKESQTVGLMMKAESKKSFRSGLIVNGVFFLAGILAGALPISFGDLAALLRR